MSNAEVENLYPVVVMNKCCKHSSNHTCWKI